MAGNVSEDYGVGRPLEDIFSGQRCQSGEALAEWRSSEQVENGTTSTSPSPPHWDSDDYDDCGLKPSELFGRYTWKIEKYSEINKREHRSNVFEIGGYKWYILIYPHGCDVCNHLSLFLCVANHDKLLPGWSHFAQFTIAVVNKDPKKSKYSDTLHRFWKKEHDWGWKKFMESSKVHDGFIVSDTLVIKAQVQVIREKSDRLFRCLDCQYRRELVRVYLMNVEQICRRFVEERRGKLGKLIEDKIRWSSFCAFWSGLDQNARRRMSREKTDVILKVVVKHFFIEKEVTSTLVMDSLYSGLKALECQSLNKKGRAKLLDNEEIPAPIISVEKDTFVLVDDVLLLLERAALEPLPPKDEKGPQNRTKDGSSGEDNKDSIERDERRLTELGRRTVEIFVLAHIFSNRIEVAYQEAVALKRQEELIREEEAAGQVESEQKSKRGAAEKEKRSKKKQAKQRRNVRKEKDRGREEKADMAVRYNHERKSPVDGRTVEDFSEKQVQPVLEKPDVLEDVSDMSDSETFQPDFEERDVSPVSWDTDTSEVHPATEATSSGASSVPIQNGRSDKRSPSVMDDSSSTCSTDSVPSVVMNGPYKGRPFLNYKNQTSPSRGKNMQGKEIHDHTSCANDTENQPAIDAGCLTDASGNCSAAEPEPEAAVVSLKDRIQLLEQHLVEKEEEVVSLQRKLSLKDQVNVERLTSLKDQVNVERLALKDQVNVERLTKKTMAAEVSSSASSPARNVPSYMQSKPVSERTTPSEPVSVLDESSKCPQEAEKAVSLTISSPQIPVMTKLDGQTPTTPSKPTYVPMEKPRMHQVPVTSRPLSAPLVPGPRPIAPATTIVQTVPSLSRSVSASGRLGTDVSTATPSFVPQSYRNAIIGKSMGPTPAVFALHHSSNSVMNPSQEYSQPPPVFMSSPLLSSQSSARNDQGCARPGFSFGTVTPEILHNRPQWLECPQRDASSIIGEPSMLNNRQKFHLSVSGTTSRPCYAAESPSTFMARQSQGVPADEFPHLDIINDLLDEEHSIGGMDRPSAFYQGSSNGHHHSLNRQFTFPGEIDLSADLGSSSINRCRSDRPVNYHDDGMQRLFRPSGGHYDGARDMVPQIGLSSYSNGQFDGVVQNQWPVGGADLSLLSLRSSEGDGYQLRMPEYSNNINGYNVFRPSNGH